MDERAIVLGLRQGKTDAWRALYDAFAERVWRGVARLLGPCGNDVADVVQETFLAAAKSARTYDASRGPLWAWLWGIARLHVALHFRKQARVDRVKLTGGWLAERNGEFLNWVDGKSASPPELLEAAELSELVRTTLLDLPPDYESLLTAKYLDETPVEEIAREEKLTPVAVRSKLARARQAFRETFAKWIESDQPATVSIQSASQGGQP